MARLALGLVCISVAWVAADARQNASEPSVLTSAIDAFWSARDPEAAERRAGAIVESGAEFDLVLARIRAGRPYSPQPAGLQQMPTTVNAVALDNVVEVPDDYDPARTWALRVQLHGGVSRPPPGPGEPPRPLTGTRTPGESQIYLHPRAFDGLEWWRDGQVDNILNLVDAVKRRYNVDESRVYLLGISDGGTGAFFLAMRAATPWAACASLIGHPAVLANPATGADQLYYANLVNCPMYIVNGGRDRLYPAESVLPWVELMGRIGVSGEFHVHPEAGHTTSWWPSERPLFEKYLAAHARVAHPERLSWETDRTDRYARIRWLVIDELGKRPSDVPLEDANSLDGRDPMFPRQRPSGRVDLVRKGNVIEARTRGVRRFTLLLSPDVIDFARPVQVVVNGRTVFDGRVKKDVATLVKWAARDNDRTMLYGAALAVSVP